MKTRQGFVSNSSSSSFVIITTKEKWDAAKKTFTEQAGENLAKVIIGEYGRPEKAKILGQDALVFQGVMSSEEYGNDTVSALERAGKITEDEAQSLTEDAYSRMGEFEKILKEDGVSYCGGQGY